MKRYKCIVIVLAAGSGRRMNSKVKKQFLEIGDKPILVHTLEKFNNCKMIDEIILVTGKDEIEFCRKEIIKKYGIVKVKKVISGGDQRQDSVFNGLKEIENDEDIVLVHDGARPFIADEEIERCILVAKQYKACVLAVRVKDTIKKVDEDGNIIKTLDRDFLWSIQTPQVFKTEILRQAHMSAIGQGFIGTDDASLVEKFTNIPIKVVEGKYTNIKITTPEDISFGEVILR